MNTEKTDQNAANQPVVSAPASLVSVTEQGTVKIIASEALAELHSLLEDARHLLEDCSAIGILDAGWRARRQALIARMEAARTHGQAAPSQEEPA